MASEQQQWGRGQNKRCWMPKDDKTLIDVWLHFMQTLYNGLNMAFGVDTSFNRKE